MVHTPDLVRVHRRFSGPDRRSKKWIRILSPRPIFVVSDNKPQNSAVFLTQRKSVGNLARRLCHKLCHRSCPHRAPPGSSRPGIQWHGTLSSRPRVLVEIPPAFLIGSISSYNGEDIAAHGEPPTGPFACSRTRSGEGRNDGTDADTAAQREGGGYARPLQACVRGASSTV